MRSHAERRNRAVLAMAVLVTAVLTVPVASGIGAATEVSAVPATLVGRWSRTVTSSDLKRARVPPNSLRTGVWSIVIGKFIEIYAPGDIPRFPSFAGGISVTGNRVSFTSNSAFEYPFCITKGIYPWKVVGKLLTMSTVSDKCRERVAVFTGVWKRK